MKKLSNNEAGLKKGVASGQVTNFVDKLNDKQGVSLWKGRGAVKKYLF